MSKTTPAYTEGYSAYPNATNPYQEGTSENNDWAEGFNDAKEDDSDEDVDESGFEEELDADGDFEEDEDEDETDEDE